MCLKHWTYSFVIEIYKNHFRVQYEFCQRFVTTFSIHLLPSNTMQGSKKTGITHTNDKSFTRLSKKYASIEKASFTQILDIFHNWFWTLEGRVWDSTKLLSYTVDLHLYALNRDYRQISQDIKKFVLADFSCRRTIIRQSLRLLLAEIMTLEQVIMKWNPLNFRPDDFI